MKKIIVLIALFAAPLVAVHAQQISSARITSLAGLSTAVSTDIDAIGTNPANLMAVSRGTVVVEFIPLTITTGSDFFNLNLYNQYFTGQTDSTGATVGKFFTQQDKQNILNAFPGGIGNLRTDLNVRDFGLSIRLLNVALGFSVDDRVGVRTSIPSSPFSLVLNGLPWGSTLSLNGLALESYWYRTYNADFAMRLPDILAIPKPIASSFEVGIGLKYVTGLSYGLINVTNSSIYVDSANQAYSYNVNMGVNSTRAGLISRVISKSSKSAVGDTNVNFNPFSPQGTGLGIDLGVTAKVMRYFKVGISLTDIGSISWTKDVINTNGADTSFSFAGFSPAQTGVPGSKSNLDSLNDAFKDYFKNKDSVGSNLTTSLPTKLNIGVAVQIDDLLPKFPGQLVLAVDYHQGLNNEFNNSTKPELDLGTEWRPIYVFPLRTGISIGGAYGFRWAAGFGFNLVDWDFDIGVGTLNAVVDPAAAKNISFTLSILKFRI